jgi:hypothetical protein
MNLVGVASKRCGVFACVLMASAALSIFIALTSALQERALRPGAPAHARRAAREALRAAWRRRHDARGCGRYTGLVLGHAAEAIGRWLARSPGVERHGLAWEPAEGWIVLAVSRVGAATCLIPAIQAYRRDPATVLLEQ